MNILGLDPASVTGWAHSNGQHGRLELRGSLGAKLDQLHRFIIGVHRAHGFGVLGYEDAGFGAGPAMLATMAFHNALRGVIEFTAYRLGVKTIAHKPTAIKKFATDNGNAKKDQMIRAVKTIHGVDTDDHNIADAVFICDLTRQMEAGRMDILPPSKKRKVLDLKRAKEAKLF